MRIFCLYVSGYKFSRCWTYYPPSIALRMFVQVCLYLVVTTEKEPNLKLSQKERYFVDPSSGEKSPFPTIDEEPTLNLSVVVPAYKEESRRTCFITTRVIIGIVVCSVCEFTRIPW